MSGLNRAFIEATPMATASTPAQSAVGTDAVVLLAANPKRKGLIVQNTGLTVIKLTFGATVPTATAYHVALSACSSNNDGLGGIFTDDAWVGVVNALSSGGGGTCVVTEFTVGSPDWNQAGDWGLT